MPKRRCECHILRGGVTCSDTATTHVRFMRDTQPDVQRPYGEEYRDLVEERRAVLCDAHAASARHILQGDAWEGWIYTLPLAAAVC